MKNKTALVMIISGTVLIISALLLCAYNIFQDKQSGQKSQEILNELKKSIIVTETNVTTSYEEYYQEILNHSVTTKTITADLPKKELNNINYAGYITIPAIGIELPVVSELSYGSLEYAPCIYSGTALGNNLIIAAHNYSSHFRSINSLNTGDLIYFIDVDGNIYEYQTSYSELIDGNDAFSLLNDQNNSWDLTLFTCTLDGRNRITIRAVKTNYE